MTNSIIYAGTINLFSIFDKTMKNVSYAFGTKMTFNPLTLRKRYTKMELLFLIKKYTIILAIENTESILHIHNSAA